MTRTVFSIPSGFPFLRVFADGLIERHYDAGDPHALARVCVLLPTRRALAALRETFLERLEKQFDQDGTANVLVLPRLFALGDPQEDALEVGRESAGLSVDDSDLPPAISPIRRRVYLARLVHAMLLRENPAATLAHALAWADSLCTLLDEALVEGADLKQTSKAVPAELAAHWQVSKDFLEIVLVQWPAILTEEGVIEAIDRRARLMRRQASLWRAAPPGPIYIAGSTGSQPATAELMLAVSELTEGAVVLPGLDVSLSKDDWQAVDTVHPQFGLKSWLDKAGLSPTDVSPWPGTQTGADARFRLLSEALRPAPTTDSWADILLGSDQLEALKGLRLSEVDNEAEEALIISLLMKEALETEGKTAALVTPNRALARRVASELARWNLRVDDSSGVPLHQTNVWLLLRHIAEVVNTNFAPIPLLAMLRHADCACGLSLLKQETSVDDLERICLRGPRPGPGLDGLRTRLDARRAEIGSDRGDLAARFVRGADLIERLDRQFAPITELINNKKADMSDWVAAHVSVAEALASTDEESGAERLWRGPAGETGSRVMNTIASDALWSGLDFKQYADLFERLSGEETVRPRARTHPRLAIWGPLEARLQSADLIILGSLTEETWPQRPKPGPWVNLEMRAQAGLPDPERRIGLSAHDFQSLAAGPEVVLSVPAKIGGEPVLPSRWVLRLTNFLEGRGVLQHVALPSTYRSWARALNRPDEIVRDQAPAPKPAVSLRPRALSVTEIETHIRDPYAIYARHILGLRRLDRVDEPIGARQAGIFVHKVMEAFVRALPDELPSDGDERLLALAAQMVRVETNDPFEQLIWLARLTRAKSKYLDWERTQRALFRPLAQEVKGRWQTQLPAGPFELRARADRVDGSRNGAELAIYDYKTGQLPTNKQIEAGLKPQLALEALIAQNGGFDGVDAGPVSALINIQVGGANGFVQRPAPNPETLAEQARARLVGFLSKYDNPDTPYLSWIAKQTMDQTGDYDLLARLGAWGGEAEAEE